MAVRYVNTASSPGGDGTTNKIVDADRAYASLTSWDAARQATLSEIEEVICEGATADTACLVDGWTTSAANYILIRTDPAAPAGRHEEVYSTSCYRLTGQSSGFALGLFENYTRVDGLQVSIEGIDRGGITPDPAASGVGGCRITNNLVRASSGAITGSFGIWDATSVAGPAPNIIANNIVLDMTGTGCTAIYARSVDTASRRVVYNNTVYNSIVGFRVRGPSTRIKNNLAVGCTDGYLLTDAAESGSTNNGYDEGADPATAGTNLAAFTDAQIFVNAAAGDLHLVAGSPAINAGADLSADADYAFAVDIEGDARVAWDLGADEFAAVAGNDITVFLQEPVIGGCVF